MEGGRERERETREWRLNMLIHRPSFPIMSSASISYLPSKESQGTRKGREGREKGEGGREGCYPPSNHHPTSAGGIRERKEKDRKKERET
jgi:hypothetical protein